MRHRKFNEIGPEEQVGPRWYDPEIALEDYVSMLPEDSPLTVQVGGEHYKHMSIQPIEFIMANSLGFCEGNAIKYICRYMSKGGVQDLDKAIHYLELLKENYNGNS
jgi:hypothetical protein|tara:strand:- start:831 stop:1148 length:318 start_codon:yes stop_codon:yes gene_type:complete